MKEGRGANNGSARVAVDRERREILARGVVGFLRDEISMRELWESCPGMSERDTCSADGKPWRGFAVNVGGATEEVVVDPVLRHAVIEIHDCLRYPAKRKAEGFDGLVRVVALLRSELDGEDLKVPRRKVVARFAVWKLAGLALGAMLVTAVVGLVAAPWVGPALFGLWPVVGVAMLWWHPMLYRDEARVEAGARPFLRVEQYKACAHLVTAEERGTFRFERRQVRHARGGGDGSSSTATRRWSRVLWLPLGIFVVVGVVWASLFFGVIALMLWPCLLYDRIRSIRRGIG